MFADEHRGLEIAVAAHGDKVAVDVAGELDTTSAPRLITMVHDLVAPPVRQIDVDCKDVWFLDSAGVRALLIVRNEAARLGVDLALVRLSAAVKRLLDMTGLTGTLTRSNTT